MSSDGGVGESEAVLAAARRLVDAFGNHAVEDYFASFTSNATFLFHSTPRVLRSRSEYEALWQTWEAGGFRVVRCESSDHMVRSITGDVAIFTHSVFTVTTDAEGEHQSRERETIVFQRQPDGSWLGVHEHLSPAP